MALGWTSALAFGVPELDAQHEELFRQFERLEDAILAHDRSAVPRVLAFLQRFVHQHLATEEALMAATGFPGLQAHAAEHLAFAREIERLERDRLQHGTTAELVLRLDLDVAGWLRDHIYTSDQAFGRFLATRSGNTRSGAAGVDGPASGTRSAESAALASSSLP